MNMRPYIIINCAMSLDGKIALPSGEQARISSEEDMVRVHKLRNSVDAILVGVGTILADDPKLTVKKEYVKHTRKNPIRIVLDSHFRTPENAEVMKPEAKTIIVTTTKEYKKGLLEVIKCGKEGSDKVDIEKLMEILYERGIKKLLVEGGSTVIWEFLSHHLFDELHVYIAPFIIGGGAPTMAGGEGIKRIEEAIKLHLYAIERYGDGLVLKFIPPP